MPISHKHKVIFVHIPKTGGTSIANSLEMNPFRQSRWRESVLKVLIPYASKYSVLAGRCKKKPVLRSIIEKVALCFSYPDVLYGYDGNYRLHHLPANLIKEYVSEKVFQTYFKFAIVRNPWDRLVSEFFWRQQIRKEDCGTFEQFVRSLNKWYPNDRLTPCKPPFLYYCDHAHFLSQSRYIFDTKGRQLVDHIFCFENIQEDFAFFRQKLGVYIGLEMKNKTSHRHYSHYYNRVTQQIVHDYYQEDIKRFGYSFSSSS
jgi:hypothetical protein